MSASNLYEVTFKRFPTLQLTADNFHVESGCVTFVNYFEGKSIRSFSASVEWLEVRLISNTNKV